LKILMIPIKNATETRIKRNPIIYVMSSLVTNEYTVNPIVIPKVIKAAVYTNLSLPYST
jgi:hypothetical protein